MDLIDAQKLYNKLISQYGMKAGWFAEDWHIRNALLNVGGWDFEILRFSQLKCSSPQEPICVFSRFYPLESSKSFTGWTLDAVEIKNEEEAHKLIDNLIKQLKYGYVNFLKQNIENDF